MAIENTRLRYSSTYDVYVDVDTYAIYKRNNRRRKTEITDAELVPLKIYATSDGYLLFNNTYSGNRCNKLGIYYIYADAFPEIVGGSDLHQMDPDTYCEIDHINHVHDTLESNFPQNLRWVSRKINRADTSRRVIEPENDSHANALNYYKDYYYKHRQDPEWMEKRRKKDADRKRKQYYARKEAMLAQQEAVNAEMQRRAGLR